MSEAVESILSRIIAENRAAREQSSTDSARLARIILSGSSEDLRAFSDEHTERQLSGLASRDDQAQ